MLILNPTKMHSIRRKLHTNVTVLVNVCMPNALLLAYSCGAIWWIHLQCTYFAVFVWPSCWFDNGWLEKI